MGVYLRLERLQLCAAAGYLAGVLAVHELLVLLLHEVEAVQQEAYLVAAPGAHEHVVLKGAAAHRIGELDYGAAYHARHYG